MDSAKHCLKNKVGFSDDVLYLSDFQVYRTKEGNLDESVWLFDNGKV